jgi:hypothetical protein
MNKAWLVFSVAVAAICVASPGSAGPVVFTNRTLWQAAAGGTGNLFENFESFLGDTTYSAVPVTAGFLTLSVVNGSSDTSWRIDVIPAAFPTIPDVNGSTFAITLGQGVQTGFGSTSLTFAPVFAVGFDYAGADYSTADGTLTTSRGDSVVLAKSPNSVRSFIGLLYTGGETFSSLTWSSTGSFAAGIDNVEGIGEPGTAGVPDGGNTLLLMGGAMSLLEILRRRRG